MVKRVGPDDKKMTKEVMESIMIRMDSIQECYKNFRNNPFNNAYVHRLRVEMRKLRALLHFLKPLLNSNLYKEMNGILRRFGKQLSPLRDLDTVIEICSALAIEYPAFIRNYADVFHYMELERHHLANKNRGKEVLSVLDKYLLDNHSILITLEKNINQLSDDSLEKFVQKRFKKKSKKLIKKYRNLDLTDYDNVHAVRKEAKKVRYAAVGFKRIIPNKDRKYYKKKAKYIQEHLGELTDIYVSMDLLEKSSERALDKEIKESLKKLSNVQIQNAKYSNNIKD